MRKTIYLVAVLTVLCFVDFIGCRNINDGNPIGTDSTTTASSVLSGRAVLMGYSNYTDSSDYSGINVQLLNSTFQTQTDVKGFWKFQNLDSGVYSIQFAKQGFDTVIVRTLNLKNRDSLYIGDTGLSGAKWGDIVLNEVIIGSIINPSAQIRRTIGELIHDSTVIFRDTTYDFSGSMEIGFSSIGLNNKIPYDICWTITNSPTIDLSKYPLSSYTLIQSFVENRSWDALIYGDIRNFNPTNKYNIIRFYSMSIAEYAKWRGYSLNSNTQLYLHIVPVWLQWTHGKNHVINNFEERKRGEVVSIPIAWQ